MNVRKVNFSQSFWVMKKDGDNRPFLGVDGKIFRGVKMITKMKHQMNDLNGWHFVVKRIEIRDRKF